MAAADPEAGSLALEKDPDCNTRATEPTAKGANNQHHLLVNVKMNRQILSGSSDRLRAP